MSTSREFLKKISQELKLKVQQGQFKTVNDALLDTYKRHGYNNLKTPDEWINAGYRIKKGAEAVYIWGRQINKLIQDGEALKDISFFPLKPLFSEKQVYKFSN